MKHRIALVCALMLSGMFACSYAKTSCKVIHVADKACHVLVLQDGTEVPITAEDLEMVGRTALARDAGADR